jgi:hypothetical protein
LSGIQGNCALTYLVRERTAGGSADAEEHNQCANERKAVFNFSAVHDSIPKMCSCSVLLQALNLFVSIARPCIAQAVPTIKTLLKQQLNYFSAITEFRK